MHPRPSPLVATAIAIWLGLALPAGLVAPAAHAMQNIKCIKNEVGALASRWSQQAGEARARLGDEGARAARRAMVEGLAREGRRLASACSTCGALKEAERVRSLVARLQADSAGKPADDSMRALDDTLAQIEGLSAEFGL